MTKRTNIETSGQLIGMIRDMNKIHNVGLAGLNTLIIDDTGRAVGCLVLPALSLLEPETAALQLIAEIELLGGITDAIVLLHDHQPLDALLPLTVHAVRMFASTLDLAGPDVGDVLFVGTDHFTSANRDGQEGSLDNWVRHDISEVPEAGFMLKGRGDGAE